MEKLHIQPSELDMLPYFEYEITLEMYNDIVKKRQNEENKQSSLAEDKYNVNSMQNKYKLSSYKQPSLPKINLPRV